MTCVELQDSLAEIENGTSAEQLAHLATCRHCKSLVRELTLIVSSAAALREADEPSPRVWNSIEIALRQEGLIHDRLIHDPRPGRSLVPAPASPWLWTRWILPVAAALLIALGLYVRSHTSAPQLAEQGHPAITPDAVPEAEIGGLNDDDLLQEIGQQTPAVRARYTENLRRVNEYIQDAKSTVATDPNDEEARRSLMDAYQQKAMLFDLAMDHSLP